jgi:hypothetical protein
MAYLQILHPRFGLLPSFTFARSSKKASMSCDLSFIVGFADPSPASDASSSEGSGLVLAVALGRGTTTSPSSSEITRRRGFLDEVAVKVA